MKNLIIAFSFLIVLSSCTPLRVVRLEPDPSASVEYDYGEKVVTETTRSADIRVSYYDATPNYLVFNMSVANTSDAPLVFDPAESQIVPDVGPVSSAIDPEVQLLSMDLDNLRRAKNQRTMAWVGAGLLVAGAVADVSVGGFGGGEGLVNGTSFAEELAFATTEVLTFAVIDGATRPNRMLGNAPLQELPVPESRQFWLDHSLRITTIQPGETAFGKLVFVRNDEASEFSVQVSVDGQTVRFPFDQKVFR